MVDEHASISALLALDASITEAEETDNVDFLRRVNALPEGDVERSHVNVDAGGVSGRGTEARASARAVPGGVRAVTRDVRLLGRHRGLVVATTRVADRQYERVRLFLRPDPDGQDWRVLMSASEELLVPDTPRQVTLPEYLENAPARLGDWEPPTAWLLGAQLIGSLRRLVLSMLHSGFDLRDWMSPGPLLSLGASPDTSEHWIDYLSDTGDSPRLVYLLASALYQPDLDGGDRRLPRGSLLLIGGDTAYPIADRMSLAERVQAPFVWAKDGPVEAADRRLLFGVPGNHDYYDILDGFARQFRRPVTGDDPLPASDDPGDNRPPSLQLPGFVRVQQATYFAIGLPFGWQLWGLDVGSRDDAAGKLDFRQRQFFRGLPRPSKLILATSKPVMVHRKPIAKGDPIHDAIAALGLPTPHSNGGRVPAGDLRLDLSGDTHVYERYYGQNRGDLARPGAEPGAESRDNYATVVSGLGGAFHHPEQVIHGDVAAHAAWPTPGESARAIGGVLLRPGAVFRGGSVWVVGAVLGMVLYLLGAHRARAGSALDALLMWHHGSGKTVIVSLGDAGRTALFVLAALAWLLALRRVLLLTRTARERVVQDRQHWSLPLRLVQRLVKPPWMRSLIRFLGGNPRVAVIALLVTPPWLLLTAALVGLWHLQELAFFSLSGRPHAAAHLTLVVMILGIAALALLNLAALGARTVLLLLFGVIHGALHALTPLLWTRVAIEHHGWPLLLLLGYLPLRWALTPLLSGSPRVRQVTLLLAWCAVAALALCVPLWLSSPGALVTAPWWGFVIAAFTGALFACLWVGWYFLVCLQWGGHGNEAGASARVDSYAQFLRIRLTADAAEVWSLAVSAPTRPAGPAIVRVIDRFRISLEQRP
jgi:hypothetical protein